MDAAASWRSADAVRSCLRAAERTRTRQPRRPPGQPSHPRRVRHPPSYTAPLGRRGRVRLKAPVLKTGGALRVPGGSNPSASAEKTQVRGPFPCEVDEPTNPITRIVQPIRNPKAPGVARQGPWDERRDEGYPAGYPWTRWAVRPDQVMSIWRGRTSAPASAPLAASSDGPLSHHCCASLSTCVTRSRSGSVNRIRTPTSGPSSKLGVDREETLPEGPTRRSTPSRLRVACATLTPRSLLPRPRVVCGRSPWPTPRSCASATRGTAAPTRCR